MPSCFFHSKTMLLLDFNSHSKTGHLTTALLLSSTFRNPDKPGFQIPTVFVGFIPPGVNPLCLIKHFTFESCTSWVRYTKVKTLLSQSLTGNLKKEKFYQKRLWTLLNLSSEQKQIMSEDLILKGIIIATTQPWWLGGRALAS